MSEILLPRIPQFIDINGKPIVRSGLRSLFQVEDVRRRLARIQGSDQLPLKNLYDRMIEEWPTKFDVKPTRMPLLDELEAEVPNFSEVIREIKRRLVLVLETNDPLDLDPILLFGPPGIGKTHFGRKVAELLGTGFWFIPMSSTTAGWVLSGASSQWKGARPGKVFQTLFDHDYINPVMMIDEIDKARGDQAYDPLWALYTLLEKDTAAHFADEFVEVPIDASRIVWFATANDEWNIPAPILSRFAPFKIGLTRDQARSIADWVYRSFISGYDWGKQFDPNPSTDVLDVAARSVPRQMRKDMRWAFWSAKLDKRSVLLPRDFPPPWDRRNSMGFVR